LQQTTILDIIHTLNIYKEHNEFYLRKSSPSY